MFDSEKAFEVFLEGLILLVLDQKSAKANFWSGVTDPLKIRHQEPGSFKLTNESGKPLVILTVCGPSIAMLSRSDPNHYLWL